MRLCLHACAIVSRVHIYAIPLEHLTGTGSTFVALRNDVMSLLLSLCDGTTRVRHAPRKLRTLVNFGQLLHPIQRLHRVERAFRSLS